MDLVEEEKEAKPTAKIEENNETVLPTSTESKDYKLPDDGRIRYSKQQLIEISENIKIKVPRGLSLVLAKQWIEPNSDDARVKRQTRGRTNSNSNNPNNPNYVPNPKSKEENNQGVERKPKNSRQNNEKNGTVINNSPGSNVNNNNNTNNNNNNNNNRGRKNSKTIKVADQTKQDPEIELPPEFEAKLVNFFEMFPEEKNEGLEEVKLSDSWKIKKQKEIAEQKTSQEKKEETPKDKKTENTDPNPNPNPNQINESNNNQKKSRNTRQEKMRQNKKQIQPSEQTVEENTTPNPSQSIEIIPKRIEKTNSRDSVDNFFASASASGSFDSHFIGTPPPDMFLKDKVDIEEEIVMKLPISLGSSPSSRALGGRWGFQLEDTETEDTQKNINQEDNQTKPLEIKKEPIESYKIDNSDSQDFGSFEEKVKNDPLLNFLSSLNIKDETIPNTNHIEENNVNSVSNIEVKLKTQQFKNDPENESLEEQARSRINNNFIKLINQNQNQNEQNYASKTIQNLKPNVNHSSNNPERKDLNQNNLNNQKNSVANSDWSQNFGISNQNTDDNSSVNEKIVNSPQDRDIMGMLNKAFSSYENSNPDIQGNPVNLQQRSQNSNQSINQNQSIPMNNNTRLPPQNYLPQNVQPNYIHPGNQNPSVNNFFQQAQNQSNVNNMFPSNYNESFQNQMINQNNYQPYQNNHNNSMYHQPYNNGGNSNFPLSSFVSNNNQNNVGQKISVDQLFNSLNTPNNDTSNLQSIMEYPPLGSPVLSKKNSDQNTVNDNPLSILTQNLSKSNSLPPMPTGKAMAVEDLERN